MLGDKVLMHTSLAVWYNPTSLVVTVSIAETFRQ